MLWVEVIFNKENIFSIVKCIVCMKIEHMESLFQSVSRCWNMLKREKLGKRLWIQSVHMP
jgi:hypothetical protein